MQVFVVCLNLFQKNWKQVKKKLWNFLLFHVSACKTSIIECSILINTRGESDATECFRQVKNNARIALHPFAIYFQSIFFLTCSRFQPSQCNFFSIEFLFLNYKTNARATKQFVRLITSPSKDIGKGAKNSALQWSIMCESFSLIVIGSTPSLGKKPSHIWQQNDFKLVWFRYLA